MNLLENYSLVAASKIGEMDVLVKYFPCPPKFITVHAGAGGQSKTYDYWNEIIRLISPKLTELGYLIIQIGDTKDEKINNSIDLRGKTEINQTLYILSKSSLHIGNDSFPVHFCGYHNIPLICLYGATNPRNHGPYWYNKEKTFLIESHRNGEMPSFSYSENPKSINLIKPEEIVNAIGKILESNFPKIETIHIGENYNNEILEYIPNAISKIGFQGVLNIRADYHFDANKIYQQIQLNSSAIITNKPLDVEILKKLKTNVVQIIYKLEKDYSKEFIKKLHNSVIPYVLMTEINDKDLDDIKLDLIDFNPILKPKIFTKETINKENKINANSVFRTKRYILAEGKLYPSRMHWSADESCVMNEEYKIIDDKEFYKDAQSYFIYNKL